MISEAYGYTGRGDELTFYDITADVPALRAGSNYGTLVGFWNSITYAPLTLIAGGITDKVNRKNMIFISCFFGGICTCANYYAARPQGLYILISMRALNGAFSAFFQPATYSLINDMFPKSHRTRAFFLY
jgi:MFS family permease